MHKPATLFSVLQVALPHATVHPIMTYVHDWAAFFVNDIYDSVTYLNTAREFIVRKRNDDGNAFRLSSPFALSCNYCSL